MIATTPGRLSGRSRDAHGILQSGVTLARVPDRVKLAYRCASTPLPRHIDVGTSLASRYEIQGLLGRGGMGLVFKALDHTLGEVVALKVLLPGIDLSPEVLQRFRSEAKLARKVHHRNVCAILGYEEDGDVPFIVMELVLGTDLKRHLHKVGAMEWEDGFEVSLQVTEGLAAIHEAGVIHRDLKPANITRDDKGIVRVMDFGIAKGGTHAGLTDDGKCVGTIDYMSPEQIMSGDIDARSDIYSFGVVIYELFTGRVPFKGDTPAATMRKHLEERASAPRGGGRPHSPEPGPRARAGAGQGPRGPLPRRPRDAAGAAAGAGGDAPTRDRSGRARVNDPEEAPPRAPFRASPIPPRPSSSSRPSCARSRARTGPSASEPSGRSPARPMSPLGAR